MVEYKTVKHRKTALDWSKLKKKPTLTRILELSTIVQRQTKIIFNAISCGEVALVKSLIKDGGFFDPNIESKFYVEMKRIGVESDKANVKLGITEQKMRDLEGKVEEASKQSKLVVIEVEGANKELDEAFLAEDEINRGISNIFREYETTAGRLIKAELEHVTRVTKPEIVLRIAVLSYAIMFEVLDTDAFRDVTTACSPTNYKTWWPNIAADFKNSNLTLRKIKSFSMDRLMSDRAKPLISFGRKLFKYLTEAVEKEKEKHNLHELHLKDPQPPEDLQVKKSSILNNDNDNDSNLESKYKDLPMLDSDSDHDDSVHVNTKGSWVKGEWVPKPKAKRREEKIRQKTQDSIGSSKSNKLVFVSEFSGNTSNESKVMTSQSEKVETISHTNMKVVHHSEIISDYIECYPFIETILALLNAVVIFANDRSKLLQLKKKTALKSMRLEDLKIQLKEARVKYEEEFNYRDSVEKELIADKRRLRSLNKKVDQYREKVRVARLLNQVSVNGHTPISWAASMGSYEMVEEMLSRGSTVGWIDILISLYLF